MTATAAAAMSRGPGPVSELGAGVSWAATALGDGDTASVGVAGVAVGEAVGEAVGGAVSASVGAGVAGGAVGATVGGAVRTDVGGGAVGGGGAGVLAARTTTVPFMNAWIAQWYANVPAVMKVNAADPPARITPVSQSPPSAVAVWLMGSALVHRTVSPTRTVVDGGLKDEL